MKKKLGFLALAMVLLLGAVVVYAQSNRCQLCLGTGYSVNTPCTACLQTGKDFSGNTCPYCKGSGILMQVKCIRCGGNGIEPGTSSNRQSPGNSGGGTTVSSCPHCNGSGTCSSCNGKGWLRSPYATDVDCPNCYMVNGKRSGKCQWCKGTGKR